MLALHVLTQLNPTLISQDINITSNNKRAYKQAFSTSPLGLQEVVQANYDIILEIHRLRKMLTFPLRAEYAPRSNDGVEHSTPIAPPLVQPQFQADHISILHDPESHIISVVYKGEVLVSNLIHPIMHELYYQPVKKKLQRDNQWTELQFCSVDWPTYKKSSSQTTPIPSNQCR
jgi:hypothetical protein